MDIADRVARCVGFEWDEGNFTKSWDRHDVSGVECEQVFFNHPLLSDPDVKHSAGEDRFRVLGQTDAGRLLFLVFTIRKDFIRVITARDMNRKERKVYESS